MLQCVGYYVEICEISNSQAQSADDALLLCPESHNWGLWSNLLPKFGDNFWLSERGHFPPSKPCVGLSTAKLQHFFE